MIEMTERPLCPDPEALGIFAEGSASQEETVRIREHLATCNDCLDEVGEVTRFATETPANVVPMPRGGSGRRGGWLAAAAALVVVAGGAGVWRMVTADPADALRRSLPADNRIVEPRLYGFAHRKFERLRGAEKPDHISLSAAGTAILARAEHSDSVKMKHAEGLAKLLLWQEPYGGDIPGAVTELTALTEREPRNAYLWNDLAAARLTRAEWIREKDPQQAMYRDALAAAEEALKLKPELREALFNRALALEGIDPVKAKAAWEQYIQTEADPGWKEDAQQHLDHLQ
ncbi:MAG TPA: zf-HC2 domain-containing protein [Thermoanaerobaculia bacterium]|jgi:hypothetical protein|nr:zf-HC2 domain-containing protein [Thermoanaerobaculia bacterium]